MSKTSPDTGAASMATPGLLALLYAALGWPLLREGGLGAPMLASSLVLGAALVTLSAIDFRTYRLPDALTLPLIAAGPATAWAFGWGDPLWRSASAAGGFLFLFGVAALSRAIRGRDGMGLGDAKLFAAAGGWLGWEGLPAVLMWSTGAALAWVAASAARGARIDAGSRIAFGPFLALGFWLVWLYGAP